ncbi:RNA-directed DNA polymerase [Salmonella enterica]|nr:RNA-directed DNA polymerase [Salmonella enterica]
MIKRKKLTTNTFLSLLSDDHKDRFELSTQPIGDITSKNVIEFKIGSKTCFKFKNAGVLEQYQERINRLFLSEIEVSHSAFAYVKNKSYLEMFESHRNGYYFLRVDIKSFFHNISRQLIADSLSGYISDEDFIKNKQKLMDAFINLITLNVTKEQSSFVGRQILPIGFKTSPAVSNIIFRRFDNLIQSLCSKNNIVYTRYADDMLFSSPLGFKFLHTERFMNELSYILSLGGFSINNKKTLKDKHMITLNGYVIESSLTSGKIASIRISNKKTDTISKLINKLEYDVDSKLIMRKLFGLTSEKVKPQFSSKKNKFIDQYYESQLLNAIAGYRAYLISIVKFNLKYNCVEQKYILKYQRMIDKLSVHILKRSNW